MKVNYSNLEFGYSLKHHPIKSYSKECVMAVRDTFKSLADGLDFGVTVCSDDISKSSMKIRRNFQCAIAVDHLQYYQRSASNADLIKECNGYINEFLDRMIDESDLLSYKYESYKPENDGTNPRLLEIKDIRDNLKSRINDKLSEDGVNEETKAKVWNLYLSKYEEQMEKLKSLENTVKDHQTRILKCGFLQNAYPLNTKLKSIYDKTITELKSSTDFIVKHFAETGTKIFENSNLIQEKYKHFKPENILQNSIISEIKTNIDDLKPKIDTKLNAVENINQETKTKVWEAYQPKYDQHIEKLRDLEKTVKGYEDQILKCNFLNEANVLNNKREKKYKEINDELNYFFTGLFQQFVNKALEILNPPVQA